jgi:RHS repeat-associated protein
MKSSTRLILTTSPLSQTVRKPYGTVNSGHKRFLYRGRQRYHTGKERDNETGLLYYGARYLDSRTGRWISGDPAMADYVPSAPVNDEARRRNWNLPGQGGVFNYVNLHVYHYAGNNPVKYTDPNGRTNRSLTNEEWTQTKEAIDYAVTHLDSMINELKDYASGASETISDDIVQGAREWLDKDLSSTESFMDLADDLTKIRDNLASKTKNDFKYDNNLADYALINPISGRITLSPKFFKAGYTNNDTKPGILIHEASHSIRVLCTQDYAYGTLDSGRLRNAPTDIFGVRRNPWQNADNWGYFFERNSTGGQKR